MVYFYEIVEQPDEVAAGGAREPFAARDRGDEDRARARAKRVLGAVVVIAGEPGDAVPDAAAHDDASGAAVDARPR